MARRDEDFPIPVLRLLAERAGYHCSIPWCPKTTIGPGRGGPSANTGIGAHIFSAKPAGPRGDARLTVAELRDYDNGLWCCTDHGRYIDAHGGNGFDPATLKAYRRLAEARATLRQQGGLPPPVGWFHRLHVIEAPPLAGDAEVLLGKNTLMSGPNGSGKTIMADMLAGLGKVKRWSQYADSKTRHLEFEIEYYDPERRLVRAVVGPKGSGVTMTVDGEPSIPLPRAGIVHFSYDRFKLTTDDQAGLETLASTLDEDPNSVRAALIGASSPGLLGVRPDGDDLEFSLPSKPGGPAGTRESFFSLSMLGGTEQPRVGIEAAVILARQRALTEPTLLVVDDVSAHFDEAWTKHVLDLVQHRDNPFQTLVITAYTRHWPALDGWTLVEVSESTQRASDGTRRFEIAEETPLLAI